MPQKHIANRKTLVFKGTVRIFSPDPPCKNSNCQLAAVPLQIETIV